MHVDDLVVARMYLLGFRIDSIKLSSNINAVSFLYLFEDMLVDCLSLLLAVYLDLSSPVGTVVQQGDCKLVVSVYHGNCERIIALLVLDVDVCTLRQHVQS